jgi:hypothetical protein
MPAEIAAFVKGIMGGAGKKVVDLLFGPFSDEDDPDSEESNESRLEVEGSELIKQIGEHAENPEDIPKVLDGFEIDMDEYEEGGQKSYNREMF